MSIGLRDAVLISMVATAIAASAIEARDLTFEDRVKAQTAIERVYYSHQIDATRPFETAVPRALLERKVETYLEQTSVLDTLWRTPIDAELLDKELERIALRTRMPERLREIFVALDDDPYLIRESFARQILASRLARNFFAFDERIHGGARARAEAQRRHPRNYSWPELMARVFLADVLKCGSCGGRLRILTVVPQMANSNSRRTYGALRRASKGDGHARYGSIDVPCHPASEGPRRSMRDG